jgi:hypothetical protein
VNDTGKAGNVVVAASGHLAILDGGIISSDSYFTADAGSVSVSAATMTLDGKGNNVAIDAMENPVLTGIGSSDYVIDFPRQRGPVTVTVKADLSILDGRTDRFRQVRGRQRRSHQGHRGTHAHR